MELLKATEENIDKMVRKGLNSKSWFFILKNLLSILLFVVKI